MIFRFRFYYSETFFYLRSKDGKELRPSNKMTTTLSPDGVAELAVLAVNHNDAGRYKLEATNEKGRSGTESTVSVGCMYSKKSF